MTIGKGETWGEAGALGPHGIVVDSDARARAVLRDAQRARRPYPELGLLHGDLARTCGATGRRERFRDGGQRLPVDVVEVLVDGALDLFVAHLVIRSRWSRGGWWHGPTTAVMNAQFIGSWDVAPRSHPNDGRVDVVSADLPFGDRLKARSRLSTGTHLPHPGISVRRTSGVQLDVPAGASVWLDGEPIGPTRALSLRVVPDAVTVVV